METGSRVPMLSIDESKSRAAEHGIPESMAELSV